MKKILLALFILIGFSVSGQVLQAPNVYGYQFRRVGGDTLLFIPGDTLQVPATYNSKTFIARKGTSLYYWNGTKWTAITGGGSADTTSLSNRINLKLNISDTAAMLANYRKVDSLWRVPGKDSTFWLKNGTTYKLKDSIGSTRFGIEDFSSNVDRYIDLNNKYLWVDDANAVYMYTRTTGPNSYFILDTTIATMTARRVFNTASAELTAALSGNMPNILIQSAGSGWEGAITVDSSDIRIRHGQANLSEINVKSDTIKILPPLGNLFIDSLNTTTDTTTYKPLGWQSNGQVRRFTSWPVGGASGITSLNSQTGGTQTFATGRGLSVSSSSNVHTFTLQNDTTTLAVFGGGSGAAGDTAAFTTDALYGSLYIDVDTFVVTKIVAVIQAGATDTLGIQIYFNDSLNTGTTGVATSTLALTSRPQGHSTTTLSNATIPPGSFIWCKSPTVVAGRKPEYLSVSIIGYRKRRS